MTIYERALELMPSGAVIGLGSGRAAWAFVKLLGKRIRAGRVRVRGVPTSEETARVATQHGVPLVGLDEAGELALTVDGADEVDPHLDLLKGYGPALVREKVVAASSRRLVISACGPSSGNWKRTSERSRESWGPGCSWEWQTPCSSGTGTTSG